MHNVYIWQFEVIRVVYVSNEEPAWSPWLGGKKKAHIYMSLPYLYQTHTIQPKTLHLHRRLFQPPLPHQKLKKTHGRLYSKFKCLQPQQQPPSSRMPPIVAKILRAELNAILLVMKAIQSNQTNTYIFTNKLKNMPHKQWHLTTIITTTSSRQTTYHHYYPPNFTGSNKKYSHTQSTWSHQHSR